uniref:EF-hand domain family member B n=1 Tax=Ovis aries TaxID=9940 RepID=A0AC11DWV9_SHEEP
AHFRPGVAASGPSPRPRGRLREAAGEAESGRGSRTGALSCSLTWRGHLRNGARTASPRVCRCRGRKPDCANPAEANVEESEPTLLLNPEDIVLKEPGSSEKTLRTLLRPGDKVSNHYKTTSSEISAVVGAVPSTCYPTYGVPTIRSDLPAPLIRRVSDRRSYGEEGNAYSLLHPTVFAQKGVFERDFFKTRSKQETPLSVGFSKQDAGVGCHSLLQGTFRTQGSNARLSPALAGEFFTAT